jgi:hypothetical protein
MITDVIFVCDGFGFAHIGSHDPTHHHALHRPGERALTSAELLDGIQVNMGEFVVRAALDWSRFADPASLFGELRGLLNDCPTSTIAPAHENVVVNVETAFPLIQQAYMNAFLGDLSQDKGRTRKRVRLPPIRIRSCVAVSAAAFRRNQLRTRRSHTCGNDSFLAPPSRSVEKPSSTPSSPISGALLDGLAPCVPLIPDPYYLAPRAAPLLAADGSPCSSL